MATNQQFMMYAEQVLDYLDYLGYPDYVLDFDPHEVARAMHKTQMYCFNFKVSYIMCSLIIFGMTWESQVIPLSKVVSKKFKVN